MKLRWRKIGTVTDEVVSQILADHPDIPSVSYIGVLYSARYPLSLYEDHFVWLHTSRTPGSGYLLYVSTFNEVAAYQPRQEYIDDFVEQYGYKSLNDTIRRISDDPYII